MLDNRLLHGDHGRFPTMPFQVGGKEIHVKHVLHYLKANLCPFCNTRLKLDVQDESVFAYCDNCHDFDASVHMDLETKEVVLGYSSVLGPEGFVDAETLNSLANVLVRRN
ncbi:MAG: hypothetical protein ACTSUE_17135, partial [Promethearchaeota archaeon]